jgi:hypothetical protein
VKLTMRIVFKNEFVLKIIKKTRPNIQREWDTGCHSVGGAGGEEGNEEM